MFTHTLEHLQSLFMSIKLILLQCKKHKNNVLGYILDTQCVVYQNSLL